MNFNKPFNRCHWHTDRYDRATLVVWGGFVPDILQDIDLAPILSFSVPQSCFKKRILTHRNPKKITAFEHTRG